MAEGDRSIRASDDDRERTAAALRDHYAAGRLTSEEFNERLDKTYAAKTLGDLADLKTDLPVAADGTQLPVPSHPAGPVATGPDRFSPAWRAAFGSWLCVSLVCFVIWLLSGASASLWFLWPTGIWGAVLLARWISGGPPSSGRAAERRQHRRDYRRYRRGY